MENYYSMAMNVIEINQLNGRNNVNGFNVITKDLIMWAVENEKKNQHQKFLKHLGFIEAQMTSFLKLCGDMSSNVRDTKNYTRSILNSFEEKSNCQNYNDILLGLRVCKNFHGREPESEHRNLLQVDENTAQHTVAYNNSSKGNQNKVPATPEPEIQSTSFKKVNDEGYLSANVGHSLQSESSTSEYSEDSSDVEERQNIQEYYDPEQKHKPVESVLNNNSCNMIRTVCEFHDLSENCHQRENVISLSKYNGNFFNSSNKNLEKYNEHLQINARHDSVDEEILLEFKRSVSSSYILESKSNFSSLVEDELKKPLNKNVQTLISEASCAPVSATDNGKYDGNTSDKSDFEKKCKSFTNSSDSFDELSDDQAPCSDCDSEIEVLEFTGFTAKDIHLAIQSIEQRKNIVGSSGVTTL
ncbi:uncharacterized protein LOC112128273 [Cimex lectularius]|uniref:Uncharacterized protein n=1 Tax=Cimex lectularius TaxID=79782 RepID=A0A8I6SS14_CIMLE|nr:uncharacterized protein LOC112128273 [Cimex lectularius]